jgi:tRNA1(Val) A37 N6-methylase TrmN6
MDDHVTCDRLLGGRLRLLQPESGLRAAIDPVLLAAAVEAGPEQTVLELGTGTGVALLCLTVRVPGISAVGLEVQPDLALLAGRNAALNGLSDRVKIMAGDVGRPPLMPASFDQVILNPPYLALGTGTLPPGRSKAKAVGEAATGLAVWIKAALSLVRPRGRITLIHRADRLAELLAAFGGEAGEIVVFPLWKAAGKPAGRVLLRARKGVASPLTIAAGLVLHEADGAYTEAADAVLRDAAPLALLPAR